MLSNESSKRTKMNMSNLRKNRSETGNDGLRK